MKLSKYFVTICFASIALVSIWFNYDKVKDLSENFVSHPVDKVEQIAEDILDKDIKKEEPKEAPQPKENKQLETQVLEYLNIEDQLNIIDQSIEKSDYKDAANLVKNLKLPSHTKELDAVAKELESLDSLAPINLFPGNSMFLSWVKSIFSVNYIQDSKANEKKKDLLDRVEALKQEASKELKQIIKHSEK